MAMDAYLLLAGEYNEDTEIVGVFIGKNAGANKAAAALTAKRGNRPEDMRTVRAEPIDVVGVDGATR